MRYDKAAPIFICTLSRAHVQQSVCPQPIAALTADRLVAMVQLSARLRTKGVLSLVYNCVKTAVPIAAME